MVDSQATSRPSVLVAEPSIPSTKKPTLHKKITLGVVILLVMGLILVFVTGFIFIKPKFKFLNKPYSYSLEIEKSIKFTFGANLKYQPIIDYLNLASNTK